MSIVDCSPAAKPWGLRDLVIGEDILDGEGVGFFMSLLREGKFGNRSWINIFKPYISSQGGKFGNRSFINIFKRYILQNIFFFIFFS